MSNKIFVTPETLATPLFWGYSFENAFFAINKNPDCVLVHGLVGVLKEGADPRIINHIEKKGGELTMENRKDRLKDHFDFEPYAWIEEDEDNVHSKDEVSMFDPSHGVMAHRDAWYHNKVVVDVKKYKIDEANEAMTANNNFGPWHVSRIII